MSGPEVVRVDCARLSNDFRRVIRTNAKKRNWCINVQLFVFTSLKLFGGANYCSPLPEYVLVCYKTCSDIYRIWTLTCEVVSRIL